MRLLKNLFIILLMLGIYTPSYAAGYTVNTICSVFNEEINTSRDNKDGDEKGEEEEPDCE